MKEQTVDFSDPGTRQLFFGFLKTLEGKYRVTVTKYRKNRTKDQNSWYHVAIVEPFREWLIETGIEVDGREPDHDDAHEMLRDRFLPERDAVNKATGEVFGKRRPTTTDLNTKEFSEYCERCSRWMAEFCGIAVQSPTYKWDQ